MFDNLSCRVSSWAFLGVALAVVGAAAQQPSSPLYVKKDTWPQTMLATRSACLARSQQTAVELGTWHTTGPLPAKAISEALFPEAGIDLTAKGPDGKPRWEARPEWSDGRPHDLPGSTVVATYLYRTITVSEPCTVEAGLGSDDGIEVWLNGKKLLSNDASRGLAADQERVTLDLAQGENRLLLKIFNHGGGHGFYFALGEQTSTPLVWQQIEKDYPLQAGWMRGHLGDKRFAWLSDADISETLIAMLARAVAEAGPHAECLAGELNQLTEAAAAGDDPRWLCLYEKACRFRHRPAELKQMNLTALRLAVEDLTKTWSGRYARGPEFLNRLAGLERRVGELEIALAQGDHSKDSQTAGILGEYRTLQQEALLANPLLDFDRLLLVRRGANQLGLPQNWQGNCALPRNGYDNEVAILSPVAPSGSLATFYRPQQGEFVGDVDLDFDAGKLLFSMPGTQGRWQIWEIKVDGSGLRQVTPGEEPDVDNYDPCYLPDGRIVFASTRCFHGVPCVGGGNTVANLCLMDADGQNTRQLCFDQDHNWCPTVLNNGRILYARWEYSDSPHYFTRLLFHMNPDGTNQMEYYASNSMWPNSIFYARPIPNHPTKVVAVISGHHGVPRMGELVLFDPARGRHESSGTVQRIPGYGEKVDPVIRDGLVEGSWPKYLHPYPLSDKYFLVSCKPTPDALWGLYLVDLFDNRVLLKELPGYALLEPVPLRKTRKPPAIPERVNLRTDEATVYVADIYRGKGLEGVPRGTVRKLRIYSPHYAYPGMGGHIHIGIDGPWDARRILGTVPVEADGSAAFRVPANLPLAVQPLDAEGRALQVMRSWFTAMPGETISCVGCHESQNTTPPTRYSRAAQRMPASITPWYGPERSFSFRREVQPVLDKHCVGCHNGQPAPGGKQVPDFSLTENSKSPFRNFTPSYVALHPYVRRPGPESDYHLQEPLEWHASTSELVQMLKKGHHNVALDGEAWDRLYTWIDLNVPDHGTWHEHRGGHSPMELRRREMRTRYANRPEDLEAIVDLQVQPVSFVQPATAAARPAGERNCPGWPFDAVEAKRRQEAEAKKRTNAESTASADAPTPEWSVDLGEGVTMKLVLIPPGEFLMGDADGSCDELPVTRARIERPFYLGRFEVTNAQYARFNVEHDSGVISQTNKDQNERGYHVNGPNQPVVRISWEEAMHFCQWLSRETGKRFTLPTEAQWEWACRAGTATPFWFGAPDSDFSRTANLADATLEQMARGDSPKWHPRDARFRDNALVTVDVGRYEPNPWGLCDVHGNAAEWTRSAYRPYPNQPGDGRDQPGNRERKVVRGGSWYDRPARSRSSFRLAYEPWQRVYNVGFRVLMEIE